MAHSDALRGPRQAGRNGRSRLGCNGRSDPYVDRNLQGAVWAFFGAGKGAAVLSLTAHREERRVVPRRSVKFRKSVALSLAEGTNGV